MWTSKKFSFQSASWKRHCATHWREQCGWELVTSYWFVLSMSMQVNLDSSFAHSGSAPTRGGKKGEFRDWTTFERACLTSFREHHEDITKSLFRSISENQDSKLHHLIPEAYSPHYNFRRQRTYNVPAAKTKRFANSFFVKCAAVTNSSLRWMRTF